MDALREQCEGGFKMSAYKDKTQGTWYVSFRYIDWTGKKTQKLKRGFKTKKEALNYEKEFIRKTAADMKMEVQDFGITGISNPHAVRLFKTVPWRDKSTCSL